MMQYNKTTRNIFVALLFASPLMGCVNTDLKPTTFYYILDKTPQSSPSTTEQIDAAKLKQIRLLPVVVPNYLRQPNLVLKLANHQIKIANYHYWAQDLNRSIERILVKELNSTSVNISYSQRCDGCDELIVSIDHFYPTELGKVVLAGNYELISTDGKHRITSFSLSKQLDKGGYDEAVEVMRELLSELASQFEQ
jgi:uncharacterized lipoprotein YmbA